VESYNSCANAGNSSVFSFTTASCATYSSTNVPVNISASGTPTITSTINVAATGTINDLNVVDLVGNHTWISDLTVTLTSPQGTNVVLWDGICGDAVEDWDIILDDQAASATLPCPPTDGNAYQPLGALSAFSGEQMNGTWTLTIEDNFNQDGGALESWGLNICFTPTVPCTNPTVPSIAGTTSFCAGGSTTLSIGSGTLNDATDWEWYSGSCGGTSVGSGTSINVSTPGTYFVRGEGGCVTGGSCQSVTVTQTNVNTTTTLFEGVLTANQNGATYQWVDCNNGNADIPGETGQNFVPAVNGSYAVEVTIGGCTATSSCVAYNVVGLSELSDLNIVLYPNPTSGTITVDFGKETAIDYLNVTDVTGRLVREERAFTSGALNIDLSRESKGVYFLNVQAGGELQTLKITRQ
jgi:subtilisin-like proprotein convertase family protein